MLTFAIFVLGNVSGVLLFLALWFTRLARDPWRMLLAVVGSLRQTEGGHMPVILKGRCGWTNCCTLSKTGMVEIALDDLAVQLVEQARHNAAQKYGVGP